MARRSYSLDVASNIDATASDELTVKIASGLGAIDAGQWNACANPKRGEADSSSQPTPYNPFISYAFLSALEDSRSVGGRTGWSPAHIVVEDSSGTLTAVAPAYLKSHSQGEYVFDHGWADAFERAGGDYYPKVQVSVPFTPATGRRLLLRPGPHSAERREALIAGLRALRDRAGASSIHFTFLEKADWDDLGARGFLQRTDKQFHWINQGYRNFEDFLGALSSRKRGSTIA